MHQLLIDHPMILIEAAVLEVLRRGGKVCLHPLLMNGTLIYELVGRQELRKLYLSYGEIALEAGLPILLCTPTWRANQERVGDSYAFSTINEDAARFMLAIKEELVEKGANVKIGGLLGCKNDCYKPEQCLGTEEATIFHSWQIAQLVKGGVDFLFAATLPNVDEALGIARAMSQVDLPYIISFVIDRSGKVLDGKTLLEAVQRIDEAVSAPPLGYMVNCAYPTFLYGAREPQQLHSRLIGFQANASKLNHRELDGADQLYAETVSIWGRDMLTLHRNYGIKILGGCCGTTTEHLRYLTSIINLNK